MTDWYERTIKALQLNGKGEHTQECFARAVRMLSEFYEKTPDFVTADHLHRKAGGNQGTALPQQIAAHWAEGPGRRQGGRGPYGQN